MITPEMFDKGKFWNKGPMVVTGCTKVSEGCRNCWSEQAHVMRQGRPAWPSDCLTEGKFNGKIHFNLDALKKAVKGKSCVISPWNDLYHEGVTDAQIDDAFGVMMSHEQHTYLIITKRIDRASEHVNTDPDRFVNAVNRYKKGHFAFSGEYNLDSFNNIIHIATMENQARADERMPHLLRIPGKRGIIIEPMLSEVDLTYSFVRNCPELSGCEKDCVAEKTCMDKYIHQAILGPENGKGKRPFKEEWAESVRQQCEAAGVPFYRKDKGEGQLIWR